MLLAILLLCVLFALLVAGVCDWYEWYSSNESYVETYLTQTYCV